MQGIIYVTQKGADIDKWYFSLNQTVHVIISQVYAKQDIVINFKGKL